MIRYTRLLLFLLLVGFVATANAQRKRPSNPLKDFLNTQWWLGLKFGTNLSQADPTQRYSAISPINFDAETLDKSYDDYSLIGAHAGIDITFYHRGFSIGIQPNFRRQRFSYQNTFTWAGATATESFETTYEIEQRMDLLELPFYVKYDITRGKARPYVMAGVYYAIVSGADKKADFSQTDFQPGSPQIIDAGVVSVGVKDAFNKSTSGFLAGLGVSYDALNIRTVLELAYRQSFGEMIKPEYRFTETELAGIGDTYDDFKLKNISLSISFLFPLRYISSQFQPY
ncbi:MAG: outer membrane beta-barrel protein [Cyclobacteriaceae bacterium]|nr:outer membrane beta-barrel protein [Cyclobacteriaceae bacterium HetDA_MAG_MS6]